MKNNNKLRELLGITQEQLALLLNVSRSQLSLYEIGKRDLPIAAKLKLATIISNVQNASKKATNVSLSYKKIESEKKKIITDFIIVNKHKQSVLEKKSVSIEKKKQANTTALYLTHFIKNEPSEKSFLPIVKGIENKAQKNKDDWKLQFNLQLKLKILKEEEIFLENYLKTL